MAKKAVEIAVSLGLSAFSGLTSIINGISYSKYENQDNLLIAQATGVFAIATGLFAVIRYLSERDYIFGDMKKNIRDKNLRAKIIEQERIRNIEYFN